MFSGDAQVDGLTFVATNLRTYAELLAAFAWPLAMVAVFWLVRGELQTLIKGIRRLTYPGGEALIDREFANAALAEKVVQAARKATNIPASTNHTEAATRSNSLSTQLEWADRYDQLIELFSELVSRQPTLSDDAKRRYGRMLASGSQKLVDVGVLSRPEASQLMSVRRLWGALRDTEPSHISDEQIGIFNELVQSSTQIVQEKLAQIQINFAPPDS